MTLELYDPDRLDQLALRLLDLAAIMRDMANRSREHGIADLTIHDKKALDWCAKLDHWAHKSQAEVEIRVRQAMAERRALSAAGLDTGPEPPSPD
jgi:DnaJ-domain-containing protein 1